MNAKTNKLVIPAIIIGGGVALYFLNKKGKLDKIKALISGEKEVETTNPVAPVITGQTTVVTSNPLGNAAAVKAFQEYYNSVKPANLPALNTDGNFGPLTAAAYNSYKDAYATAAAAGTTPTPTPTTLKKGDKVNAKELTATYSGYTLANPYTKGGNDDKGNYKPGYYVGRVLQIVGSATQVERVSQPYVGNAIYIFWVKTANIEKSLL
jgi:hypothetical protein